MQPSAERLCALLEPTVTGMGYELLGIEVHGSGRRSVVRIYIDSENGIGLEDCERVSRQVSGLLEVEDPIQGAYHLEVSSPGLDRPLFREEHYRRYLGRTITLKTAEAIGARRNFKGVLRDVESGRIAIEVEGRVMQLELSSVRQARLVPDGC